MRNGYCPTNGLPALSTWQTNWPPTNPFNLYQHLFTDRDFDLYEENGDWAEQREKLDTRRETAILGIFQQDGVDGVIRFAESVSSPGQVG